MLHRAPKGTNLVAQVADLVAQVADPAKPRADPSAGPKVATAEESTELEEWKRRRSPAAAFLTSTRASGGRSSGGKEGRPLVGGGAARG